MTALCPVFTQGYPPIHHSFSLWLLACNSTFGYDFEMQYHKPKAKANIRAASLVEINYIHMNDFLEIMECYPKFFERFKTEYKHSYDLNDPDEVSSNKIVHNFLC